VLVDENGTVVTVLVGVKTSQEILDVLDTI
jgi:hypothetical protein